MAFGPITDDTRLSSVMIVQQIAYGFNTDLCKYFCEHHSDVEQYAYIVHDFDLVLSGEHQGEPVEPHIHLIVKFKSGKLPTAKSILERLNAGFPADAPCIDGYQRFEHIGKHAKVPATMFWASACAYLTHELPSEQQKGKHQYDRALVTCNFDLNAEINKVLDYLSKTSRKAQLVTAIIDGSIQRCKLTDYCTAEEFHRYRADIEDAFEYRELLLARNTDRQISVMYLQGEPGSGKTNFAKDYCKKRNLTYSISSGSRDAWQDYNGEQAFILDDWRPAGWSIPDMLKMCDNHTISSVNARYHNKDTHNLQLLIITSVMPFNDIWNFLDGDTGESRRQLSRRVAVRGIVTKTVITLTDYISGKTTDIPNPALMYRPEDYKSPLDDICVMYSTSQKDVLLPDQTSDNQISGVKPEINYDFTVDAVKPVWPVYPEDIYD